MRRLISTTLGVVLLASAYPALADTAIVVDEAVMVDQDPDLGNSNATYLSSGGYAVTSSQYVDAVGISFDLGTTGSVSQATLRLPIDEYYSVGGSVPLDIYAFSDNGLIEYTDFRLGSSRPIAEIEAAGLTELVVDVTAATNALLRSGQFAGFRIVSGFSPEEIPDPTFPAFKGVKFDPDGYTLEFTPGSSAVPGRDSASYDGFKLATPNIKVPDFGIVYAELHLVDVNNDIYQLEASSVDPVSRGPIPTGSTLLNCNAFDPPEDISIFTGPQSTYSIESGLLDIAQTSFNGVPHNAVLQFIEGTNPMQFRLLSLQEVSEAPNFNSVSILGGGTALEPSQDFIPLCHGWVLIGDTSRNRLVERNVITGETGGSYVFNTRPDQFTLDDEDNMVYMTTHPQTERLYSLDLDMGIISYNRIIEDDMQFAPRDIIMGEDGNIFTILYDAHQFDPENPDDPVAASGLWLGYLTPDADPVMPSIPLADPISIEYDRQFQRVYLTTQSNLATFEFDPDLLNFTFVTGTDVEIGSNCTDFAVSPNGRRLAYVCPNGNNEDPSHLSIHDLDPLDYYNPDGEWYLGATPISATFSPEGDLLITADDGKITFFDVVTHLPLDSFDLGTLADEVVKKIRISRDGEFLLVFIENELDASNSKMYWMPMPDISGTPDF